VIVPARELMPVIRAALLRNQHVRLTATGSSMFPFIRGGDVVELEPLLLPPVVGDLVLAQCPVCSEGERYVLHRVIRILGEEIFLRGDAQQDCEGPFRQGDLLGRATLRFRHGRVRRLDQGIWRHLGLAWNRCAPFNRWLFQLTRQFHRKRPEQAGRLDPDSRP
jgi:hypothetical protein